MCGGRRGRLCREYRRDRDNGRSNQHQSSNDSDDDRGSPRCCRRTVRAHRLIHGSWVRCSGVMAGGWWRDEPASGPTPPPNRVRRVRRQVERQRRALAVVRVQKATKKADRISAPPLAAPASTGAQRRTGEYHAPWSFRHGARLIATLCVRFWSLRPPGRDLQFARSARPPQHVPRARQERARFGSQDA